MGPASLTKATDSRQPAVLRVTEDGAAELDDGVWLAREAPVQHTNRTMRE